MKIMHRIAFAATDIERRELQSLGIKLSSVTAMPGGGDPFVAFDIGEDDPKGPQVQLLLRRGGHSEGHVTTVFTKEEIDSSRWLEIGAWQHGYPQPDEDVFGYRQATYDLTDWCEQCGIGMRQKAPFRMKGEPKWGRNAIMQLVWVYNELFVTPDAWTRVFKPAGVGCRPVLNRNGVELKTVVQLVVETTVNIVTDDLASELCERCGRTKYLPVTRGKFPGLRGAPTASVVRRAEYFGSGAQADQRIIISQEIARGLASAAIRGASLKPVAELE